MKVLVIYECVPETTTTYIIEADDATVGDLKQAHGNYIGSVDNDDIEEAIFRISELVSLDSATVCNGPVMIAESGVEMVVITGHIM